MEEIRKNNRWIKRAAVIAAALVLLVGGAVGIQAYNTNRTVDSVISLDVNPSIEIDVNRKERVLSVTALNEAAQTVIGDMDLTGSDLDVAVNALVGSMLRNGYISDIANSILVSVDNDDADRGSALQAKLAATIDGLMQTDNFSGAVISQTVKKDDELDKLAEQYGITAGKAQLIRQLTTQNTMLKFEDLARLSINELNLLSESGNIHLENVQATGTASDKAYIGEAKAK
ncbi:MAG: cell wall protein, partial [Clostridia bacterium]|nr:cell wall protein [Clostridia bacterium]